MSMFNNKKIDFLAIGDIATDAFIKITDADAKCDMKGDHCKLSFDFGGKIPYESVEVCNAVGNAPNVAISVSKLGLKSYLLSYTGDDDTGREDIKVLKNFGVNTKYIKSIKDMISNYHFVLWFRAERTILVKHTEFPYSLPKDLPEANWVYLSSLASNSLDYHHEINKYLSKYKNTRLVFQPGTFQIKQGLELLQDIYSRSYLIICNLDEAKRILNTEEQDITILLKGLKSLGGEIVVITDGVKGSYAYDGTDVWFIGAYPHEPLESTGAGDAYSSAFTTALILGKKVEEALVWGSVNAMSVVSKVGPQKGLMTRKELEDFVKNLGDNYKAKKIN